jgi:hypothetical protein
MRQTHGPPSTIAIHVPTVRGATPKGFVAGDAGE